MAAPPRIGRACSHSAPAYTTTREKKYFAIGIFGTCVYTRMRNKNDVSTHSTHVQAKSSKVRRGEKTYHHDSQRSEVKCLECHRLILCNSKNCPFNYRVHVHVLLHVHVHVHVDAHVLGTYPSQRRHLESLLFSTLWSLHPSELTEASLKTSSSGAIYT